MTLNATCPKCQRRVTEQDHETSNVEPAVQLGFVEPVAIHGQAHWQHRACPAR